MKTRLSRLVCFSAAGVWGLLASGCSIPIPQAEADPTRFFVLTATAVAPAQPAANAPTLRLAPIELASYLRVRPLIVRQGSNEIQFREFARWGEPLENGIARVLREELLARGAASAVIAPSLRAHAAKADRELTVRVVACEGRTDGSVDFRAVWELSANGPDAKSASGDFTASGLRWNGKDEGTLAAQVSVAVTGLATEIAAALKR
jgi:uncharacterized protein